MEKHKKPRENQKETKKQFSETLGCPPHPQDLWNIVFFVFLFFLVFSRFFTLVLFLSTLSIIAVHLLYILKACYEVFSATCPSDIVFDEAIFSHQLLFFYSVAMGIHRKPCSSLRRVLKKPKFLKGKGFARQTSGMEPLD
jgi:hypothetical protein